ncbi:unnamed protein product [Didymodactylos carnosus]|nr:unnamed protein product [Didymodactylos carnosus]CAF4261202.1 unnamed protein product [Didymodactylos carnosus]
MTDTSIRKNKKKKSKETQEKKPDLCVEVERALSKIVDVPMPCRDSIEHVLAHFNGDIAQSTGAFKDGDAANILESWYRKTTKEPKRT